MRATPLAVLLAIVAVAVATRRTSPKPSSVELASSTSVSSSEAGPLLRGPNPPPSADVPEGARMIHGGPHHAHRSAARGPKSIDVAWRANAGAPIAAQVTTSPDESVLYVATLGGELLALKRSDGSRQWRATLGDRVYATPLVHPDGTIYVGTDAKKVAAFKPDGQTLWKLDIDGEADTGPALAKDGTILVAAGSQLLSIRREGAVAFRFAARGKIYTSPAVMEDGLVVFGSQDHHVYGVSPNGVAAWSVDLGADVDGSPAIGDDGGIFVGTDKGEVVRLDSGGHIQWRTPVNGFVRGVLSVARNGDVLCGVYGPAPHVARIAPGGGILGKFPIDGTGAKEFGIHGGPLEDADGVLFFGAQDDAVYSIGTDGRQRWRYKTGADVDAPLTLLGDGSLVVPSEDGFVTMLRAP